MAPGGYWPALTSRFVAAEVPFGALAAALAGPEPDDPAAELGKLTGGPLDHVGGLPGLGLQGEQLPRYRFELGGGVVSLGAAERRGERPERHLGRDEVPGLTDHQAERRRLQRELGAGTLLRGHVL